MNELLNGPDYDVAAMTFYQSSEGKRGDLWEAIESLAAFNEATMQTVGLLAQQNAHRGAQINQVEADLSGGGFLLPFDIDYPVTAGTLDDFRRPVVEGLLPKEQDDPLVNRGPFDTLFGWRQRRYTAVRRTIERDVQQDFSNRTWLPQPPNQATVKREVTSYSTWGTYLNMRALGMQLGVGPERPERLWFPADPDAAGAPLSPSLWARRLSFIVDRKINYLFEGTASNRRIDDPEWVTDYEAAQAILEAGTPRVAYGLYLVFEYDRIDMAQVPGPAELIRWGVARPERSVLSPPDSAGHLEKIAEHIWKDERIEVLPAEGDGLVRELHTLRYYVFLGINVGEEVEVRNPYNFTQAQRDAMPGPINFTPDQMPPDETTPPLQADLPRHRAPAERGRVHDRRVRRRPPRPRARRPRPGRGVQQPLVGPLDADVARPARARHRLRPLGRAAGRARRHRLDGLVRPRCRRPRGRLPAVGRAAGGLMLEH